MQKLMIAVMFVAVCQPKLVFGDMIAIFDFEGSSYASTDVDALTNASNFLSQATGTNSSGFGPITTPTGASSLAATWAANAEDQATDTFFEFDDRSRSRDHRGII